MSRLSNNSPGYDQTGELVLPSDNLGVRFCNFVYLCRLYIVHHFSSFNTLNSSPPSFTTPPLNVVGKNGILWPSKLMDTLEATALLPSSSIIILSCCNVLLGNGQGSPSSLRFSSLLVGKVRINKHFGKLRSIMVR